MGQPAAAVPLHDPPRQRPAVRRNPIAAGGAGQRPDLRLHVRRVRGWPPGGRLHGGGPDPAGRPARPDPPSGRLRYPASVNRPFFFAVVQGRHTRSGHRPVAVAAIGGDGASSSHRACTRRHFDPEQYALSQALDLVSSLTDDFISSNETIKTDGSQYTYHTDYLTTAGRVAQVFGGPPSRYPKVSVVVVFQGPITIAKRQLCVNGSVHCTLRRGHYRWIALIMPPVIRRLPPDAFGPGSQSNHGYYVPNRRYNQLDKEIRLLEAAPLEQASAAPRRARSLEVGGRRLPSAHERLGDRAGSDSASAGVTPL